MHCVIVFCRCSKVLNAANNDTLFLPETIHLISKKSCITTSESKGRFFLQNESIRIDSHNESNRFKSRIGMLYKLL